MIHRIGFCLRARWMGKRTLGLPYRTGEMGPRLGRASHNVAAQMDRSFIYSVLRLQLPIPFPPPSSSFLVSLLPNVHFSRVNQSYALQLLGVVSSLTLVELISAFGPLADLLFRCH